MEIFYVIGFYVLVVLIGGLTGVLVKGIKHLIEERRYKRKLLDLAPKVEIIDVEELSLQLNSSEKEYLCLIKRLQSNYNFIGNYEEVKTIERYVQAEASYRRSKRKPRTKNYRRRYRTYGRY